VHEAGRDELSHASIDNREAGYAFAPSLKQSLVVVPLDLSSFSFANIERDDVVSEAKKDEIVDAIRRGIAIVESRR
jgi:hypothetical protein